MSSDVPGPLSFANEAQFLLISEESVLDLNNKISEGKSYFLLFSFVTSIFGVAMTRKHQIFKFLKEVFLRCIGLGFRDSKTYPLIYQWQGMWKKVPEEH